VNEVICLGAYDFGPFDAVLPRGGFPQMPHRTSDPNPLGTGDTPGYPDPRLPRGHLLAVDPQTCVAGEVIGNDGNKNNGAEEGTSYHSTLEFATVFW
jgi:hypothetical protein